LPGMFRPLPMGIRYGDGTGSTGPTVAMPGGRETMAAKRTVVQSTLPDTDRKIVADTLQGSLVDLLDLSLVAKQVHWNIVGSRFRPVHLQLDEVVATARNYSDTVAERASAIGVPPDGRAETIAKTSGIPTVADGWMDDRAVVDTMINALITVIKRMRRRIDATEKPDPVTQDIYLGLTRELEKHHWMFQAENANL
jgi:starvation-inducible DNA-binding protein